MQQDDGFDDAFVALVSAHQHALRAYLLAMLRSHRDMEDVLQETNLALWKSRDKYDTARPFPPWAFGVALREVKRHRRKKARDKLWFEDPLLDKLTEDFASRSVFEELRSEALSGCVGKLKDEDRWLLDARYRDEIAVKDIAVQRSIPEKTIYWRLMRIRQQLRECIQRTVRLQEGC